MFKNSANFILPDIHLEDDTKKSLLLMERYGLDERDMLAYALECRLGSGADGGLVRFTERYGAMIDECVKDEESHTGMVNDFVSEIYSAVCTIYEEICLALKAPIDTIEVTTMKNIGNRSIEVTVAPQYKAHRPMVVNIIAV